MSGFSLSDAITFGFVVGGIVFAFISAAFWIDEKILWQDEQIKKLSSRDEDSVELAD